MKECTKCKAILPLKEFNKDIYCKGGLNHRCKSCRKQYRKEIVQKRKASIQEIYIPGKSKICSKCKTEKPLTEFNKSMKYKSGLRSDCNSCRKIYREQNFEYDSKWKKEHRKRNIDHIKARDKKWRDENKELKAAMDKQYRLKNIDKIKQYELEYRKRNALRIRRYMKEWNISNRGHVNNKVMEKYYSDPVFKIKMNIRGRINLLFRRQKRLKKKSSTKYISGDFRDYVLHIESQWEHWMNWSNHGRNDGEKFKSWAIDHILPLNILKEFEETYWDIVLIILNRKENLRPLTHWENSKKSGKYTQADVEYIRSEIEVMLGSQQSIAS